MKTTHKLLAILLIAGAAAHAQVVPEATASSAYMNYAVRYSQTAEFGTNFGDLQTSSLSGSMQYKNGKERLPLQMRYIGGYTWTITGPSYLTGVFQHLTLSQGINWRKWGATVSDDVSYLPQAPTTGFSGIPGIGEPIGEPLPPSDLSILTLHTHVIYNDATGNARYTLDRATTLAGGISSILVRFPDANGLNINELTANGVLTRRLGARNSFLGTYRYSQYSYPDYDFSFHANAGLLGIRRAWNPKITSEISAGPELKGSSNSAIIPSSTTVAVNASARYHYRLDSASLTYIRGANNGGGYLLGAESDAVNANYTREFGRKMTIGLTGSYLRTSGLVNNGVINSEFGGAQATRRFGRHFSAFANYTAIDQTSSSALPSNTLSSLWQVVGFGVSYSPRKIHLAD